MSRIFIQAVFIVIIPLVVGFTIGLIVSPWWLAAILAMLTGFTSASIGIWLEKITNENSTSR